MLVFAHQSATDLRSRNSPVPIPSLVLMPNTGRATPAPRHWDLYRGNFAKERSSFLTMARMLPLASETSKRVRIGHDSKTPYILVKSSHLSPATGGTKSLGGVPDMPGVEVEEETSMDLTSSPNCMKPCQDHGDLSTVHWSHLTGILRQSSPCSTACTFLLPSTMTYRYSRGN